MPCVNKLICIWSYLRVCRFMTSGLRIIEQKIQTQTQRHSIFINVKHSLLMYNYIILILTELAVCCLHLFKIIGRCVQISRSPASYFKIKGKLFNLRHCTSTWESHLKTRSLVRSNLRRRNGFVQKI